MNHLSDVDLLTSKKNGRQILFSANQSHPVFMELHSMVRKSLGMDRIIESIVGRLGNLGKAFLHDGYAEGKDTRLIDLLLIGDIDQLNLQDLVCKTERYLQQADSRVVLPY